jgi:hypothetical protein
MEAMIPGQLVVGNMWFDVRPRRLWPDIFMAGPHASRNACSRMILWIVTRFTRGIGAQCFWSAIRLSPWTGDRLNEIAHSKTYPSASSPAISAIGRIKRSFWNTAMYLPTRQADAEIHAGTAPYQKALAQIIGILLQRSA